MSIEYRIGWSASSNVTFHGETDWQPWWGDEDDGTADVEDALYAGSTPDGVSEALEASGFEWWVETREAVPA